MIHQIHSSIQNHIPTHVDNRLRLDETTMLTAYHEFIDKVFHAYASSFSTISNKQDARHDKSL